MIDLKRSENEAEENLGHICLRCIKCARQQFVFLSARYDLLWVLHILIEQTNANPNLSLHCMVHLNHCLDMLPLHDASLHHVLWQKLLWWKLQFQTRVEKATRHFRPGHPDQEHIQCLQALQNQVWGYNIHQLSYSNRSYKDGIRKAGADASIFGKIYSQEFKNVYLFQESGPQLILQLHIVLSTGNIGGTTQQISIVISFVSLALASSRAFFIQRDIKRADGDPSLHMVIR